MSKTKISIMVGALLIAVFFFVVGQETQPNFASAEDAITKEEPKKTTLWPGVQNSVPHISAPHEKNTARPEKTVRDWPLTVAGRYFLDNWEKFTAVADLTEAEELRTLDILADIQERLTLIEIKTMRELSELPDDRSTHEALKLSTHRISESAFRAVKRRMGEFLTPQQVEHFEYTFMTVLDFPELGGSIREFMGLAGKGSITQVEIEAATNSKYKLLRVKKKSKSE